MSHYCVSGTTRTTACCMNASMRWPTTVSAKQKSHGKTKKTSLSAVCQQLSFASEMVRRVTVTLCSLEKPLFFELNMFCSACVSVVDEDANFCKSCGRGTFLNLKCSYLQFF